MKKLMHVHMNETGIATIFESFLVQIESSLFTSVITEGVKNENYKARFGMAVNPCVLLKSYHVKVGPTTIVTG